MAVSKQTFEALHGFDTCFADHEFDIDFCLRVRAAGMSVMYTPYCKLRAKDDRLRRTAQSPSALLLERWGASIASDPFDHVNLFDQPGG